MGSRVKLALLTGALSVGISASLLSFNKQEEGLSLTAYQDGVNVWTICYGHTKGVKRGDVATQAQCDKWHREDLAIAEAGARKYIHVPINRKMLDAYTDFVFNVGEVRFGRSSMVRLVNKRQYADACKAILLYRYAGKFDCSQPGNRVCPGVWSRRQKEYRMCMTPTTEIVQ